MSFTGVGSLDHSISTTNRWLDTVGSEIGAGERRESYRVLRAWLHTLRDRLTVDAAAHFAAQLPEMLRGVFYDGWSPAHVPVKYDRLEYLQRFAAESGVDPALAAETLGSATRAMRQLVTDGALDHAFGQLPSRIRGVLEPYEGLFYPDADDPGGW